MFTKLLTVTNHTTKSGKTKETKSTMVGRNFDDSQTWDDKPACLYIKAQAAEYFIIVANISRRVTWRSQNTRLFTTMYVERNVTTGTIFHV